MLDRLDVTVSYKTVHRVLKQLEREESNTLTQADQSELAVTAYNNFEQVESIKSQRLDDNNIFHSVTTEELVKDADISADDLTQNMLRNASLTLSQALQNAENCDDEIESQIGFFLLNLSDEDFDQHYILMHI